MESKIKAQNKKEGSRIQTQDMMFGRRKSQPFPHGPLSIKHGQCIMYKKKKTKLNGTKQT